MIEMQILARILLPVQPTHRVTHAFSLLWQEGGLCKTDSHLSGILQPGDALSCLLRSRRGRPGALGMVGAEELGPAVRFCRPGPALHGATFAFVPSSRLRLRRASWFPGSSGESRRAGRERLAGAGDGRAVPSPGGRSEAGRGGGGPGSH